MTLQVSEIFGPTLQGEGPRIGTASNFLRLAGCNLTPPCAWCDTPYALSAKQGTPMSGSKVLDAIAALPYLPLVITGGEPMLQQNALAEIIGNLHTPYITVETNGTIRPDRYNIGDHVAQWVVSPKLAATNSPVQAEAYKALGAVFKFPVSNLTDLDAVAVFCTTHNIPSWDTTIMPLGISTEETLFAMQRVAQGCISRDWRLLPRLHVLLWGNTRGV